jgi:hypothetical protein
VTKPDDDDDDANDDDIHVGAAACCSQSQHPTEAAIYSRVCPRMISADISVN